MSLFFNANETDNLFWNGLPVNNAFFNGTLFFSGFYKWDDIEVISSAQVNTLYGVGLKGIGDRRLWIGIDPPDESGNTTPVWSANQYEWELQGGIKSADKGGPAFIHASYYEPRGTPSFFTHALKITGTDPIYTIKVGHSVNAIDPNDPQNISWSVGSLTWDSNTKQFSSGDIDAWVFTANGPLYGLILSADGADRLRVRAGSYEGGGTPPYSYSNWINIATP